MTYFSLQGKMENIEFAMMKILILDTTNMLIRKIKAEKALLKL